MKSNSKPPSPIQNNPAPGWSRYKTGNTRQNLEGWRMVAKVLKINLDKIVDIEGNNERAAIPSAFQNAPGEAPLSRLGIISVSEPIPLKGANAVHADQERKQSLAISTKPIFGTMRNEKLIDPDGNVLAIANIEAEYAYIVIDTKDKNRAIIGGLGVDGEEVNLGPITCRYLGEQSGQIFFEIFPNQGRATLAGTSQTLTNIVEMEGNFDEDDWVGVCIDEGGLQIVGKLQFEGKPEEMTLKNQIRRQVLRKGISLTSGTEERQDTKLTAFQYFMRRTFAADVDDIS